MKKQSKQPSRPQPTVLRQLVELIPAYLVSKLAREHGVDRRARTFTPWSHVVALLYAQLSRALSLNDVCDGLRVWATPLRAMRGAAAPSRNALSHANQVRDCALASSCSGGCWSTSRRASRVSRKARGGDWPSGSGGRFMWSMRR